MPVAAAHAQQEQPPASDGGDGRLVIDILADPVPTPGDPIADERCEDEADAGRIAGEIVVCRSLGETTDGAYDHEEFTRRYAAATQGVNAPDVDGTGLPFGMAPIVTIRGCFIPPCPKDPALLIDVEALPDAPAGSDADRIARGLPPLGNEESDRAISQAELGLPPLSE